ncbi:MAG: DUF2807 domain-containing protein [Chitinophagaceae bacterium]|nr:DUF2807 domain-containing protein [Chitinophagaceae bacterium]
MNPSLLRRNISIIICSVCLLFISSCTKTKISGSGPVETESRPLSGFNQVAISGSTDATVTQGTGYQLHISAFSNLLPYLETKLRDSALQIGYKPNTNVRNDNSEAFITLPRLIGVSTEGDGSISVTGNFTSQDFSASIMGSGNINLSEGTTQNLKINVMGSGGFTGSQFVADNAEITIRGSGNVRVGVTTRLNVKIEGSGNVYYKGDPTDISTKITGSGNVIKE